MEQNKEILKKNTEQEAKNVSEQIENEDPPVLGSEIILENELLPDVYIQYAERVLERYLSFYRENNEEGIYSISKGSLTQELKGKVDTPTISKIFAIERDSNVLIFFKTNNDLYYLVNVYEPFRTFYLKSIKYGEFMDNYNNNAVNNYKEEIIQENEFNKI